MQFILVRKLIGMTPDTDAGLSPQELSMTIVNQKSCKHTFAIRC